MLAFFGPFLMQLNCQMLSNRLWNWGWDSAAMSGDKTQAEREAGMKRFVDNEVSVMIATDVCSRGLDIKDVTHVVNYDMARDVESYIHRIGRTGRAGKSGKSVTFVNEDYDVPCAPALAKIAREAGQQVPAFLQALVEKSKRPGAAKVGKLWKY